MPTTAWPNRPSDNTAVVQQGGKMFRMRFTTVVVAAMAIGLSSIAPAYAAERGQSAPAAELAADSGPLPSSLEQCHPGRFCTWQNAGFQGRFVAFTQRDHDLTRMGYDNKITSVWNRTGSIWGLYEHDRYCGYNKSFPPGFRGYVGADMNNLASSVKNVFLFCGQTRATNSAARTRAPERS